jgi:hypothetical protein
VWILLVVVGWFLWFFGRYYFDPQSFLFPLTYGLGIGIVSGLPPTRAFLACFFGFSILAFLIGLYFSVFEGFVIFGILCGLFAMAGAIIRRILFRQRIEELYLKPWQWVLLICGVTILADRFVILGTFHELFVYHRIFSFFQFFVPSLVGLFALGLYTGAFYQLKYDELIKSVKMLSLGTHGAFLIYMIYRFVMRSISWEPFLTAILISLFFYIVLKGTQIGYKSRSKDFLNQANLEL